LNEDLEKESRKWMVWKGIYPPLGFEQGKPLLPPSPHGRLKKKRKEKRRENATPILTQEAGREEGCRGRG
jgi:hypothetical protein